VVDANTSDHAAILPCANSPQQRTSATGVCVVDDDARVQETF